MARYGRFLKSDTGAVAYKLYIQDLFYDARYSHTRMTNPDFVLLAKAMGVHAIRCSNVEELPAKMKEFLDYDGSKPVLLECVVERNEHVYPMVRPGHRSLLLFIDLAIGARGQGTTRTSSPPYLETKNEIGCLNASQGVF